MVTTRRPVSTRPIGDMEGLIDHLKPMLENYLADDVTHVFYGDIGQYLPSQFLGPRKENKAIIALSPAFDRLVGQRTAAQETRELGVDVIGFVNITPYFKAQPSEAYGERMLSNLMKKVRNFLTQQENVNLGGRVRYIEVGDISWAWANRGEDTSLRGAGISVKAVVTIRRQSE